MGASHHKEKFDCNMYLNGKGPPTIMKEWANEEEVLPQPVVTTEGKQPEGEMTWTTLSSSLAGYPNCGTIKINYVFKDGIQTATHPNPGSPYYGLNSVAYLPDNREGNKTLKLLKKAFDQGLVFKVVTNSKGEEAVGWSDIPHKTMTSCGAQSYPDPNYLKKVNKILKDKGIA
ncbi:hypothetical protein AGOR_G00172750 [Albula goreensis]|uniref:E3 ubiquitin-protein ligase n=1 Tax=Albula goreensis TaxID=1534307 RepID=A0A8T3D1Y3_9TELE|nr:hypothetical protein AGOR_G00172750 [Albula goreensis]